MPTSRKMRKDGKVVYIPKAEREKESQSAKENASKNNDKRYDIWVGARKYSKETKPISEPVLTTTQLSIYNSAFYDGDYSFESRSVKTLKAVKSQAEYDYDRAQREIAKNDYGSSGDYVRDGKFDGAVERRKKASRIINEVNDVFDKRNISQNKREITSDTYIRAVRRNTKQVDAMFKGRK